MSSCARVYLIPDYAKLLYSVKEEVRLLEAYASGEGSSIED